MNEFVRNSSNITKNNTTNDILCAINNNFVNIANNTINKEFLDEIKSPCQFNKYELILLLQILILSLLRYKEHRSCYFKHG